MNVKKNLKCDQTKSFSHCGGLPILYNYDVAEALCNH